MLTSTFIHVPSLGAVTERSLWEQGATDWQSYQERAEVLRLPPRLKSVLPVYIDESLARLEAGEADYFARALPAREHWRAMSAFPKIGYLDIETDGGMTGDSVTVIGLYDGFETHLYVKGRNLAQFAYECQDYDGFVTFFGTGFDLPMLRRRFPVLERVFADRFHIDLCPLLKRLGYSGGLKRIERVLKIQRVPETDGLSGLDAVRLWRTHLRGGLEAEDALRLLLAYNREDVVNLKMLLEIALPKMQAALGFPGTQQTSAERTGSRIQDVSFCQGRLTGGVGS